MGKIRIVALLLFCFLCACTLPAEQNVGKYSNNYEALFQAAIKAAKDIDFSITRNDIDAGIIIAEKIIENDDKDTITRRLNISVDSTSSGIKVGIAFVDNPESIKDDKQPAKGFMRALKRRAPSHLYVTK